MVPKQKHSALSTANPTAFDGAPTGINAPPPDEPARSAGRAMLMGAEMAEKVMLAAARRGHM